MLARYCLVIHIKVQSWWIWNWWCIGVFNGNCIVSKFHFYHIYSKLAMKREIHGLMKPL